MPVLGVERSERYCPMCNRTTRVRVDVVEEEVAETVIETCQACGHVHRIGDPRP